MFLTKLAFKNLVRHRNRTLITASIIAIAILMFILMDSLIGGMTQLSYDNIIDFEAGHIQVVDQNYWEEKADLPLEDLLKTDQELLSRVESLDGYQASSPELNFQARLNNGNEELPVTGKGVVPQGMGTLFDLEDQFVEGSMFSMGENRAVMGKRLADLMGLETGDYITLLVKDKNETFNTIELEISGLVHTGNPNVNQNNVYLPLNLAQKSLNVGDQVSKLIIDLEDKNMAVSRANNLNKNLNQISGNLTAYHWGELEAVTIAGAKQSAGQIIFMIILLIAAIAIINTVILAALERMEEIGMMKAMGMKNKEIIYTFMLESTGIGLLGGIIGVFLGVILVWFLARYGIDFAVFTDMELNSVGIPIIGKLYGIWNPQAFIKVFVFAVVVSLLSSIIPAYWAADKDPVEAIYHR